MHEDVAFEPAVFTVTVDAATIGKDALLKTCYWFSREFGHEFEFLPENRIQVRLYPKKTTAAEARAVCREEFLNTAIDFELRAQLEIKTAAVRELILAKAFAESGVLEDQPIGVFSDSVEERKSDGIFKILDAGRF